MVAMIAATGMMRFSSPPLGGPIDHTLALGAEVRLELDQVFSGHSKWVWDCAFSADSAYIVTASSDNTARLWDAATAETIAIYSGHTKALTGLALNDLPLDHDLPASAS
jgi:G protein beta subunit-like protein